MTKGESATVDREIKISAEMLAAGGEVFRLNYIDEWEGTTAEEMARFCRDLYLAMRALEGAKDKAA